MMNPALKNETVVFQRGANAGEEFPMLLDRATGIPLFWPTVYTIEQPRAEELSSSTITKHLEAIMFLYTWAWYNDFHAIDIETRFSEGKFLTYDEVSNFCGIVGRKFAKYCEEHINGTAQKIISYAKEKKQRDESIDVGSTTRTTRLSYAKDYITWLSEYWLHRWKDVARARQNYIPIVDRMEKERNDMIGWLSARIPRRRRRQHRVREGISIETQKQLLQIISPKSPKNPWLEKDRARNELFICMLLHLGLRRGELLGLYVNDMELDPAIPDDKKVVKIVRRQDNSKDRRKKKGKVKTAPREIPLNPFGEMLSPATHGNDCDYHLYQSEPFIRAPIAHR